MTPSIIDLPDMLPGQKTFFESMAVSNVFDDEGIGKQGSPWTVWYLTPRVFEKESEDRALQEAGLEVKHGSRERMVLRETKQGAVYECESGESLKEERSARLPEARKAAAGETVLSYWDPEIYHTRILWPVTCLFGASFGALHLICWNVVFPTPVEQWLWRVAALVSIFSMLIFMQFERVVLRWGGPLTIIGLVSPVLYLLSRIAMIARVIAAFRASDPAIYSTYEASSYWVHIL
ncbi:hypothetical protein N7G274_002048 [Stereocaulon virgatum]|uniref:Uncharacterized protein n=1 Tax=Stereocaulon virgatum TaxID=373712 RepID=A0ABR4AIN0_9LECA